MCGPLNNVYLCNQVSDLFCVCISLKKMFWTQMFRYKYMYSQPCKMRVSHVHCMEPIGSDRWGYIYVQIGVCCTTQSINKSVEVTGSAFIDSIYRDYTISYTNALLSCKNVEVTYLEVNSTSFCKNEKILSRGGNLDSISWTRPNSSIYPKPTHIQIWFIIGST